MHRYPDETDAPEPEPTMTDVQAWIAEIETLKADLEHRLDAREPKP
jgi:hypothetical protein